MKYSVLGETGLKVSRLALGTDVFACNNFARGWQPYSQEGFNTAVRVVRAAVEQGVNLIDSHVGAGDGYAQTVIGEALKHGARRDVMLCVRIPKDTPPDEMNLVLQRSLARLQSMYADMLVIDGGMLQPAEDDKHVYALLDTIFKLKAAGRVRHTGICADNASGLVPFVRSGLFDVVQVNYSIIYQEAALGLLDGAARLGVGVISMHSMSSGVFPYLVKHIGLMEEPGSRLTAFCLKFLLSDSRVHSMCVDMRSLDELERNVQVVDQFDAVADVARMPRTLSALYRKDDEENGG